MKGRITKIGIFALFIILATGFVVAQPIGIDNVTVENSTRYNDTSTPTAVDAQAGNVTELAITGLSVTKYWQGFYGNITGSIILADSSGNNFYDWNVSTPTGQVYASRNNSVSWTTVGCALPADITAEETFLGHNDTAPDSVTNTFASSVHPSFLVGTTTIADDTCPSTQAYDSTGGQNSAFYQILLNAGGDLIYTTVIEDTTPSGFNSQPWHFQLLVGEPGFGAAAETTTPYYFYLELQ
jgi:hypothetical protein